MTDGKINIAIDGPAAAGKSTVAKLIAEHLSIVYIDTGAMYRAITYKALQHQIDVNNESQMASLLTESDIRLDYDSSGQRVILDGTDVTETIRKEDVSNAVSYVASHRLIRKKMVEQQRQLANNISVVMDGRDIGTEVLPDAEIKIFLLASVEERALRRHKENIAKGNDSNLHQLMNDIRIRDERDANREVSPLVQAEDAILMDTTALTINEVVEAILQKVTEYKQGEICH